MEDNKEVFEQEKKECAKSLVREYEKCAEYQDQGQEDCTDWADRGYNSCSAFGIFSFVCIAVVWVSKWVCIARTWVSNLVCVLWKTVRYVICVFWAVIRYIQKLIVFRLIKRKRHDVHVHLLTAGDAAYYMIEAFFDILEREETQLPSSPSPSSLPSDSGDNTDSTGFTDNFIYSILCVYNFYKLTKHNPSPHLMHRQLRRTYGSQFRLTPLMLDMAYITTSSKGFSGRLEYLNYILELVQDYVNNIYGSRFNVIAERLNIEPFDFDLVEAIGELREFVIQYIAVATETAGGPIVTDYNLQIEQYKELARSYKSTVFPFLGVDPRREGIYALVKELVGGPKKPFRGIKLYPSMGFSPTDPVLYGNDDKDECIFRYCEEHGIPITTHCSPNGFSSFDDKLEVNGYIRTEGANIRFEGTTGEVEANELRYINGTIIFSQNILGGFGGMVTERQNIFAHPHLWEKVLEKYPNLYLNFAHFGGDQEIKKFSSNYVENGNRSNLNRNWTAIIAELIDRYDNAYTDISNLYSREILNDFNSINNLALTAKAQKKVMYGSDYDVVMLFILRFESYLDNFISVFDNSEFTRLSVENPYRFLFERNGDGGRPFWRRFLSFR